MGLKPGEGNCHVCIFRPRDEGGNDSCPFKNTLYKTFSHLPVHTCPRFREGDYFAKKLRAELKRGDRPEQELIF